MSRAARRHTTGGRRKYASPVDSASLQHSPLAAEPVPATDSSMLSNGVRTASVWPWETFITSRFTTQPPAPHAGPQSPGRTCHVVNAISWHPFLPRLASGSWDGTVRLWIPQAAKSSACCTQAPRESTRSPGAATGCAWHAQPARPTHTHLGCLDWRSIPEEPRRPSCEGVGTGCARCAAGCDRPAGATAQASPRRRRSTDTDIAPSMDARRTNRNGRSGRPGCHHVQTIERSIA